MTEYTKDQIEKLVNTYEGENLTFPGEFTHSLDPISSKILYSFLRLLKPEACMEFGTYFGGSALVILKALMKNDKKFSYTGFEIEDDLRRDTIKHLSHWVVANKPHLLNFNIYGDITQNLDKVPKKLDFVFIDPNWDREIAEWTYENILPRVKKGGLVCIHDWSVNKELEYQGGGFPGIFHFIDLFKQNKMPLKKIFSDWDVEEYKNSSIALSFWEKI